MRKLKKLLAAICSCSLIVGNFAQAIKSRRLNSKSSDAKKCQLVKKNSKEIKKQLKKLKRTENSKSGKKIVSKTVKDVTAPIEKGNTNDSKKMMDKNSRYFAIIRKIVSGYKKKIHKHRKKLNIVKRVAGYSALSALSLSAAALAVNQGIRLDMLYKIADQNEYANGRGCSSVKVCRYRDQDDGDKELVIKTINYFSQGIFAFGSEKMAKGVFDDFKENKENKLNGKDKEILKHFANVVDYHYGLTSAFVVYEKVNDYKKWKLYLSGSKTILNFLKSVFTQVLDCSDFLYRHDLLHGDLDFHNYGIEEIHNAPFVRVFDYGMLHRIKENPDFWESFNAELDKILRGFIVLYCYYLDIGNVRLNNKDSVFELITKNKSDREYKLNLRRGRSDKTLDAIVNMYVEVQDTFKFWPALRGRRPVGLKRNFTKEEFEQKIERLRQIIENMTSK